MAHATMSVCKCFSVPPSSKLQLDVIRNGESLSCIKRSHLINRIQSRWAVSLSKMWALSLCCCQCRRINGLESKVIHGKSFILQFGLNSWTVSQLHAGARTWNNILDVRCWPHLKYVWFVALFVILLVPCVSFDQVYSGVDSDAYFISFSRNLLHSLLNSPPELVGNFDMETELSI